MKVARKVFMSKVGIFAISILFLSVLFPLGAQAATFQATQVSWSVHTNATIYRVVVGGSATIQVQAQSTPALAVGDIIVTPGGSNRTIAAFYAAYFGAGCSLSCAAEDESSHVSNDPFSVTVTTDPFYNPPIPAGQTMATRIIQVFPAVDVSFAGDGNFFQNAAQITLQIFSDQTALNQAAQAACTANPNQVGCNPDGTVSNSSVGGAATAATTGISNPPGVGDGLLGILISIVNIVLGVIIAILRFLVWLIGTVIAVPLLESTLQLQAGNLAGGVILTGWTLVRDVVNMFFILFLIIIGLGTILKIESYNYKKLLVNLIMMALLVNFSLLIGRIIIQIADTAQFTFLPLGTGITGVRALFQNLVTGPKEFTDPIMILTTDKNVAMASTFTMLFQFIFEASVIVTFLAMAVLMLIRTVMLWILLILSPVAYAFYVLPATASIAKKWWSEFIKYALFAPIFAFFLRLTFVLYDQGLNIFPTTAASFAGRPPNLIGAIDALSQLPGGFNFTQALQLLLIYIVVLAFLWAGMIVAKSMGVMGASGIMSIGERGLRSGFGLKQIGGGATGLVARTYSGWVGRKIGAASQKGEQAAKEAQKAERRAAVLRAGGKIVEAKQAEAQATAARSRQRAASLSSGGWRALSLLNPHVVKEAWKKRREEKELRAYGPAVGHMQDTFNRIMPTEFLKWNRMLAGQFGKKTPHGLVGERAVVAKEAEELLKGIRTREDAARVAGDAFKSGDHDEIMAALKVLQHGNWQDDYMNLEGKTFSPLKYLDHITEQMKKSGFSKEEITTILDDLKETGEQTGRIRAYGYTTEDPDGHIRAANDLSFYQQLRGDDLAKVFENQAEKFKLAFDESGVDEFGKQARSFENAAAQARAGQSFDQISTVKYIPDAEVQDENSEYHGRTDVTIRDAMVARRFMDEAHIKLQRGNAGVHARNIEAAIIVDQDPEKGWTNQNALGKMMAHEIGPNIIESITGRIHESQGRLLYAFGALRDKQTGKWTPPDINIGSRTDVQIHGMARNPEEEQVLKDQRDAHRTAWNKIMDTQKLNEKMFNAIIGSQKLFTEEQRDYFKQQFNTYATNNPNERLQQIP